MFVLEATFSCPIVFPFWIHYHTVPLLVHSITSGFQFTKSVISVIATGYSPFPRSGSPIVPAADPSFNMIWKIKEYQFNSRTGWLMALWYRITVILPLFAGIGKKFNFLRRWLRLFFSIETSSISPSKLSTTWKWLMKVKFSTGCDVIIHNISAIFKWPASYPE